MRIALGQFNAIVGDLRLNGRKMRRIYQRAIEAGADLLLFPELAICGYPPEDLLHKKHFAADCRVSLEQLAADCPEKTLVVGFVEDSRDGIYNSAAVLQGGQITGIYRKSQLPNYGVFDEQRYFRSGTQPLVINLNGLSIAITICEDIWVTNWLANFLSNAGKINLIVNISSSPFDLSKIKQRQDVIGRCARKLNCAVAYCNLVGGQDELVFDGRSLLADSTGKLIAKAAAFDEDLLISDIILKDDKVQIKPLHPDLPQPADTIDEVYQALVLGTGDYVRKNNFAKVLIGLSGGIDSAIVACIATAALGAENVIGITMPTKFNSSETISDAGRLAENLGLEFLTIPIEPVLREFDKALSAIDDWRSEGIAYENLQARIRGSILMSLSNNKGALVLTTGNKSETAVGYSTLYGDTAGGFAVIKDVPKTMIYKLAEHINKIADREVIPDTIITRVPTAELKFNQKDTDSLPDYDLLDKILEGYVEQDKSPRELVESGLPEAVVRKVIRMVDINEYKRRQSPPGVKITPKAFGRDRRLPITNHYGGNSTS
jgi:NAD+ synthase (glutamine-hydrolysing)